MKKKYIYIIFLVVLLSLCIYSTYKYKVFIEAYARSITSQLEQMEEDTFVNMSNIDDSFLSEESQYDIKTKHIRIYEICVDIENDFPYKLDGKDITLRSQELKANLDGRVEKLYNEDINIAQMPLKEYYVQLHKNLKNLIEQRQVISTSKWLNEVKDFLQSGTRLIQ
ncbi:hypothetical protein SH1V18_06560 [Vallitalea longa]|uniref:Uncharacterized protein n=1 Tax=Vallitalea longa TaxID=2936439 RepID=A0A9W5Y8U7_9FIRM|nr:hypothetical protein [Vallitalea longa]GKX28176.1 hypothetical protein SH1V18_06560 [Vallitalea longa]